MDSFYQRIRLIVKHGQVIHSVRNTLAKIGIDIMPFYWVLEASKESKPPKPGCSISEEDVDFLTEEDINTIKGDLRAFSLEQAINWLKKGHKCIGVRCEGKIAAIMWIDLNFCSYKPDKKQLDKDEAYLFRMYTMEEFRGKNLAPFLRYKSYERLKVLGRKKLYSISEYYNKAAIKFKTKLGAKNLSLYLHVNLFNALKFKILLKSYS